MTFLAPGFLVAALAAGLATIALHFIAWRRPDDLLLPTARFVPDQSSRRSARAARPSDLLLLALRLALLALIGVALARPMLAPRRAGMARVIAVDRSRAVGDLAAARDSALGLMGGADVVVTRGAEGMTLFEGDRDGVDVHTAARAVFDVQGAGDTTIAALALALRVGATLLEAAVLANAAAGVVVGKVGTATATPDEVRALLPAAIAAAGGGA